MSVNSKNATLSMGNSPFEIGLRNAINSLFKFFSRNRSIVYDNTFASSFEQ